MAAMYALIDNYMNKAIRHGIYPHNFFPYYLFVIITYYYAIIDK